MIFFAFGANGPFFFFFKVIGKSRERGFWRGWGYATLGRFLLLAIPPDCSKGFPTLVRYLLRDEMK